MTKIKARKKGSGGAREGAGRPVTTGPTTATLSFRVKAHHSSRLKLEIKEFIKEFEKKHEL